MTSEKLWIGVALAVVLAACGGGSPCEKKSPCPNDPAKTPDEITSCKNTLNANMNSACYNEVLALASCFTDQTVCGSDGKIDGINTLTKFSNNCGSQNTAAKACCDKNPTASACL